LASFITVRIIAAYIVFIAGLALDAPAQRVAVLTPDGSARSTPFAEELSEKLDRRLNVLDAAMAASAFVSTAPQTPFNMSIDAAKRVGAVIGCDLFVLVKAANVRRSSFDRPEYYEAYATIYLVSAHSGRLVLWKNEKHEATNADKAQRELDASAEALASEISLTAKATIATEHAEPPLDPMEEPPDDASPLAKNFKAPVPYRRIKPEYTAEAAYYDVTATVEMTVDLDADGRIKRTEITRWAGYGLDGSVEKAVRNMNWRPAERNGKTLPMRFLLRYNFKKVEKPQQ
jgi:TonB family protein